MLFFASYWSLCHEYFQLVTFISSQMTGSSGKNKHCSKLQHFVVVVQKKFQLSKTQFKLFKMMLRDSERQLTLDVLQIWPAIIFLILSRSVRAPANMTRSKDYKKWSTKHLVHSRLPDYAGGQHWTRWINLIQGGCICPVFKLCCYLTDHCLSLPPPS